MVRLAATGAVRLAHSDEGLRELTRVVEEKDEEGFMKRVFLTLSVSTTCTGISTVFIPKRPIRTLMYTGSPSEFANTL
jgi:hypothetical protein